MSQQTSFVLKINITFTFLESLISAGSIYIYNIYIYIYIYYIYIYIYRTSNIFWVMSNKSCFMTDKAVRREVQRVFVSYQRFKTHRHSVNIGLFYSGFSFYEQFNRQFIEAVFLLFKTVRCVWVKRFYANTLLFFVLLGTVSPLKTFYICYCIVLSE